jgi:hypothetical protein
LFEYIELYKCLDPHADISKRMTYYVGLFLYFSYFSFWSETTIKKNHSYPFILIVLLYEGICFILYQVINKVQTVKHDPTQIKTPCSLQACKKYIYHNSINKNKRKTWIKRRTTLWKDWTLQKVETLLYLDQIEDEKRN